MHIFRLGRIYFHVSVDPVCLLGVVPSCTVLYLCASLFHIWQPGGTLRITITHPKTKADILSPGLGHSRDRHAVRGVDVVVVVVVGETGIADSSALVAVVRTGPKSRHGDTERCRMDLLAVRWNYNRNRATG